MPLQVVEGDLLNQRVDAIVNAWNRNVIPWWLLIPQGVSGAIKRRAGLAPFRELARMGAIPLGGAVLTSSGELPFRGIIHVAGINLLWRASVASILDSVRNALGLAESQGFESIALPVIGAGSGGFDEERAAALITEEVGRYSGRVLATLVLYRAPQTLQSQGEGREPPNEGLQPTRPALPHARVRGTQPSVCVQVARSPRAAAILLGNDGSGPCD